VMRGLIRVGRWQFSPLFLIEPAESFQVEAVPVIEFDAFEMAQHARLKIDAGIQVYFCDPPRQVQQQSEARHALHQGANCGTAKA
jgi:hypothetical protein